MFDFRLGRPSASDPSSPTSPEHAPDTPASPPAAPQPPANVAPQPPAGAAPQPPQAPRPAAPSFVTPPQAPARPSPYAAPAPPAAPAPTPARPAQDPVMIVRSNPPAHAGPTIPEVPGQAPPEDAQIVEPPSDARLPILVVEDNDDTRMLVERILRSVYDVTAVGDARSALMAMNERRYAGLVLDINLGGKETGADVLRIARSLPNYGDVFAIALTAYALPGDRERLLASGFNEYISKPFTRESLMGTLATGVAA